MFGGGARLGYLRLCRIFLRSFLYLCLRIFLRRFLTTRDMQYLAVYAVYGDVERHCRAIAGWNASFDASA